MIDYPSLERLLNLTQAFDIITVGPGEGCDYVTDGVDDAVQVNAAWDSFDDTEPGVVMGIGDLWISPTNQINLHNQITDPNAIFDNSNRCTKMFTGIPGTVHRLFINLSGPTNGADGNLIYVDGSFVHIGNMTLNGRRVDANGTICHTANPNDVDNGLANGIEMNNCNENVLENLEMWNTGDAAIKINSDITGGRTGSFCMPWDNINIYRCGRGLAFWKGGDLTINNFVIADTLRETIYLSYMAGFIQFNTGHIWVGGNRDFQTYQNMNAKIAGNGHNSFQNVVFDNWRSIGLYIFNDGLNPWIEGNGGGNRIFGCHFYGGDGTGAPSSQIAIDLATDRNVIMGNVIQPNYGYTPNAYQIWGDAGANNNVVVGNSMEGYAVGFDGSCTGNQIANNT